MQSLNNVLSNFFLLTYCFFIRKVTISGFQASIDLALSIIERKVDKASKRRAKDETDMDTD